jgi:hypothetical protein
MFMTVLLSLILPVFAGGGFIAICWLLPPLRKWNWLSGAAFGLALAIAVFASFTAENGLPTFPPGSRAQWLSIAAIFAGFFALVAPLTGSAGHESKWPAVEITAVVVGLLFGGLPLLAYWMGDEDAGVMFSDSTIADQVALGMAVALGIVLLDKVAANQTGMTMPLVLWVVFGGLAPLADSAGWITLTFLSAAASAVSFIAAIAGRFSGGPSIGRGGLVAAVILLAVFPVAGFRQTYGDFPWWCWGLVAAAPVVLVPLELPIFAKLPPWAGTTLRTVAVAVPVLIGVLVATTGGEEDESGMGGFGDYGYLEPSSGDLVALDVTSIGAMQ